MNKHFQNLLKLSKGEHSLEEVLSLSGITPVLNIDTQPRTKKEWAEDHVEGERYEKV